MCGICGYIDYKRPVDEQLVLKMALSMKHRGPNASGVQVHKMGETCQIGLGHVRLSIMDLSSAGQQPMVYKDLVIVFNGEIYNFREIRKDLQKMGDTFYSDCDTEVILHAFKRWGVNCVERFIGMFAFAVYDKTSNKIYLCRDRAGVKPLFYYHHQGVFLFASELKSMMANPYFSKEINYESLSAMFQLTYIPRQMCIFEHTFKLLAGHWLEYDLVYNQITLNKYWDIEDFYNKPKLDISYNDAKEALRDLCKSAFAYRMVSDVPVGVFLSGGYDSSFVSAILTKELGYPIKTFTIGFYEGNDEAPAAEKISQHLGTIHTTRYCSSNDVLKFVPDLPYYYDEPFNNPGAISFMLVSQLAKESVVCALSADGADEIFAGYDYYSILDPFRFSSIKRIPGILRKTLVNSYQLGKKICPSFNKADGIAEMMKLEEIDQKHWIDHLYNRYDKNIEKLSSKMHYFDLNNIFKDLRACQKSPEYYMLFDYKLLMNDNYIVKIERGSMFTSLECREPMLDHRLTEFVAQLPWNYKFHDGIKKRILKDLTYDYIPQSLLDKPKTGFVVPIQQWVSNELRDYVYDTLSHSSLQETGFNTPYTYKLIEDTMKGHGNLSYFWSLLQYVAWYNLWMKK